ncbi:hypothetical protein DS893_12355 [Vibrionales bacterium C3R12]|nr:hypothetical protein DS893_12355 [Vibrionales bacterium C3R12]
MDKWKMINKIIDLLWIKRCDLVWINRRISWDQNGYLYTGGSKHISYHWDNYRFNTGNELCYPQVVCLFFEQTVL